MNFNKCSRCGCFFVSEGSVCPHCETKDQMEINRLKDYIEENSNTEYSMDHIISSTGISNKNLNRFLAQEQFSNFASQMQNHNMTQC